MNSRKAIPAIRPLQKVAGIQVGYPFRSRLEGDPAGAVLAIQMKDLEEQRGINMASALRVSPPKGYERHLLQPGDLVMRSRGRTNGAVLIGDLNAPAIAAAPLVRIRPKSIHPGYLYWFLNSPATQQAMAAMAVGTSVQMIRAESLRDLLVPVPSLDRQREIAAAAELWAREKQLREQITELRGQLITAVLMGAAQGSR